MTLAEMTPYYNYKVIRCQLVHETLDEKEEENIEVFFSNIKIDKYVLMKKIMLPAAFSFKILVQPNLFNLY